VNTLLKSISDRALHVGTAVVAASALLTGCGSSQNWDSANAYVSIGGTVSGLSGTVTVENNGANPLPVTANGAFAFPLEVANGSTYAVTITAQPTGQSCKVTNGAGTAVQNVTSIGIACAADVTIGGTVSGLVSGASLTLTNNGANALTVKANGAFTFTSGIAGGSSYAVAVSTQPATQLCSVANPTGVATSNVTSIAVTCLPPIALGGSVSGLTGSITLTNFAAPSQSTPTTFPTVTITKNGSYAFAAGILAGGSYNVEVSAQPTNLTCTVANGNGTASATVTNLNVSCRPFARRVLPSIYTTGKAINYSPYRAGGPNAGEVPPNSDILQDLGLVQAAGFNLLRLFGADQVANAILMLAAANYPSLQFQVGIYLGPDTAPCSSAANLAQVQTAIGFANTYPNVATVSVGNETSFAGDVPASCLAEYVQMVRGQVTQPVTADDDYTFYAGLTSSGELPNPVLPVLDWVSIHTYPFSNYGQWNWEQVTPTAPNGPAQGMMSAAIANAQSNYQSVSAYSFVDQSGATVTIGATMPITIGETGWKATPTNLSSALEAITNPAIANPVNQKWYYDELNAWQGTANGPSMIFVFEAFDEAWKGSDDGWGLWNSSRQALYALCGLSVGPACSSPVYTGAGYYH
jgi:exo-beta-1,3-glucanase (GH17 family)